MLFPSIYLTDAQPPLAAHPMSRRGAVLLIVIVFLTIFATIGLAFMFYADSEAQTAQAFREAAEPLPPAVDPETAFAHFMMQLIYDCKDDESGVYSALRGHSLMRNMFGLNYGISNLPGQDGNVVFVDASGNPISNATAFNGTGRLHYIHNNAILKGADDYFLVNYTYFPQDGILRDPERPGHRTALRPKGAPDNRKAFVGGFNPPYTACDLNCMALAAIKADGTLLMPSYFRDWTGFGPLDPSNPNWYSVADKTLKYKVLRPRPADHPPVVVNGLTKPGFPAPESATGDVQNLKWGKGNDAMWLYTGAPIERLPDGRMVTMLFAPTIIDADSKINLNVGGNVHGANNAHASNQGWGAWEINIGQLLGNAEWKNLFLGINTNNVPGRYGTYATPPGATAATLATFSNSNSQFKQNQIPFNYSKVDFSGLATATITLPTAPASQWPTYPASYGNASNADRTKHPELYNVFNPSAITAANPGRMNRGFGVSEMDKLYRFGDIGSESMVSDLFLLCPTSFATLASTKRHMVTTISWDLNTVGQAPWLYAGLPTKYTMGGNVWQAPNGPAVTFPTVPPFPPTVSGGDYTTDFRGKPYTTARIDLNQTLQAYPAPNAKTFRFPQVKGATGSVLNTKNAAYTSYIKAQTDRQNLAMSIFRVLVSVTGATDPTAYKAPAAPTPGITAGEINALTYLAQLSVNIVDFIDEDDIITPFYWTTGATANFTTALTALLPATPANLNPSVVYGVELPRVAINEAYAQITNDPTDPGTMGKMNGATLPYLLDLWVELHNPMQTDTNLTNLPAATSPGGSARLHMYPTTATDPTTGYPVYQLLVTDPNTGLKNPFNTQGQPDGTVRGTVGKEFQFLPGGAGTDVSQILPNNNNFAAPNNQGSNSGFYVLGPSTAAAPPVPVPFPTDPTIIAPAGQTTPTATVNAQGLRIAVPVTPAWTAPTTPTLVLQRLLCPYAPPDPNPNLPSGAPNPTYNPYVTVDYFENIPVNVGVNVGPPQVNVVPAPAAPGLLAVAQRYSVGRIQPLAGNSVNCVQPQYVTTIHDDGSKNQQFPRNQPFHTFFHHNHNNHPATNPTAPYPANPYPAATVNTATTQVVNSAYGPDWATLATITNAGGSLAAYPAFDWLVHMDRPLVSPMELLHVSDCRPFDLTQRFVMNPPATAIHYAHRVGNGTGWYDNNTRLYRFFEYAQTWPYKDYPPTAPQRLPGKVNINTIWDPEIFAAICNPAAGNQFTAADVTAIWNQMLTLRDPIPAGGTVNRPSANSNPFRAFTTGYTTGDPIYQSGAGVQNTLLKAFDGSATTTGVNRLFEVPSAAAPPTPLLNPQKRFELLNKMYNSVTTKSNVFLVWVTVGYFEVNQVTQVNGTTQISLGQEIGRADNKQVRHRMFAIVDRSSQSSNDGTNASPSAGIVPGLLNQTMYFNPHGNRLVPPPTDATQPYFPIVPYFTIIE